MTPMARSYTAHFRIRQYELNARDELPNRVLAQLFQETAMGASADAGFGVEWYTEHRSVWVIHEMTLEHLRPIRYPDELEISTWLSDMQRVRTHREYLARNSATGEIVARARAYWAHLDRETLFPARIPDGIVERFEPNGVRAVTRSPRTYPAPQPAYESCTERLVQHYEADGMKHVNNAIYLDWLEEPLHDVIPAPLRLAVRRHDIVYVRSALPGDRVEIRSRLTGAGQCATSWAQEITRAGELVVRNRLTAVTLDAQGWPARFEMERR